MGVTIFESGSIENPTFGTDFKSTGKIVYAIGVTDETATATVKFENGQTGTDIPIIALADGNARLKQIVSSTIAASAIYIGLQ